MGKPLARFANYKSASPNFGVTRGASSGRGRFPLSRIIGRGGQKAVVLSLIGSGAVVSFVPPTPGAISPLLVGGGVLACGGSYNMPVPCWGGVTPIAWVWGGVGGRDRHVGHRHVGLSYYRGRDCWQCCPASSLQFNDLLPSEHWFRPALRVHGRRDGSCPDLPVRWASRR